MEIERTEEERIKEMGIAAGGGKLGILFFGPHKVIWGHKKLKKKKRRPKWCLVSRLHRPPRRCIGLTKWSSA